MTSQSGPGRLNETLGAAIRVKIVDVGANPANGAPPYAAMLSNGDADVIGFEPNPEALAQLDDLKGPHETYLPFAVGDGRRHTLHMCYSSSMSSLLEPDPSLLALYHGFPEWGDVIGKFPIDTVRLDDVPETAGMDLLKIDIQGAELMVFQSAPNRLRDAVVIQTEVEFLPMYRNQPLYSDVDQALRRHGFVLHRFVQTESRVVRPMLLRNDIYANLSQCLYADAVFVKDFTRADRLQPDQLLKAAVILHDCYHSFDLVLLFLAEHDRRTGSTYADRYLAGLGAAQKAAA